MLGHQVGRAFVGAHEHPPLDGLKIGRRDGESIGRFPLAQRRPEIGAQVFGPPFDQHEIGGSSLRPGQDAKDSGGAFALTVRGKLDAAIRAVAD